MRGGYFADIPASDLDLVHSTVVEYFKEIISECNIQFVLVSILCDIGYMMPKGHMLRGTKMDSLLPDKISIHAEAIKKDRSDMLHCVVANLILNLGLGWLCRQLNKENKRDFKLRRGQWKPTSLE